MGRLEDRFNEDEKIIESRLLERLFFVSKQS
jgi:hypothetical protein